MKNDNQGRYIQAITFLALLAGTLVLTYFIFRPYLAILVLSAILAVFFRPLYHKLVKVFGGRKSLVALVVSILILIIILIPLSIFVIVVSNELVGTYRFFTAYSFDGFLARAESWLQGIFGADFQISAVNLSEYARSALSYFVKNILNIFSNAADFAGQIVVFIFTLFYLLRDGDKLKAFAARLSPMSDINDREILERLTSAIRSIIGGSIVIAIVQGTTTIIGFSIFGIPSPVIWGSMAFLAALIPVVGTSIVTIPAIIYLAMVGKVGMAIGLSIWSVTAVHLIDNILGPILIGRGIKVNRLLVLLSVFGGLAFFGPLGFLFGPLVLSFLFTLLGIYQKEFKDFVGGD